jgi:hypothetical protein
MPKRKQMTVFVPAILVLLPTAVVLNARTGFAQIVASDCITNRGSAPPHGSHWYFRVDRLLHRRCWYLGPDGARLRGSASRAERPMPLPPPRPLSLSTEPLLKSANAEMVATQMTAGKRDVGPSSSLRRQRVTSSTTTGEPGFNSNSVAIGKTDAEEQLTTSAQDEMPSVWPVLTAADVAAVDPQLISTKRMLMMLAGAFACAVMMVWLIVRRSAADRVARTSPPDPRRSTITFLRSVEKRAGGLHRPTQSRTLGDFIHNSNSETRGDIVRTPSRSTESHHATEVRILRRRVAGLALAPMGTQPPGFKQQRKRT